MASQVAEQTIILRAEFKLGERRTPLPPSAAAELIAAGYKVLVEKSINRAFSDAEFTAAGCQLVESGYWKASPKDTIVLGLKELPEDGSPIDHTHIYFAHCYKNQAGWEDLLGRFVKGQGKLLDLEFLVDDKGRRVAAFGRPAGLVGAALGVLLWVHQQLRPNTPFPECQPWKDEQAMIENVKAELALLGRKPRACVVGALGRCGSGSAHVLKESGLTDIGLWDLEETKRGGPFPELVTDYDVVINCIYLSGPIPPFVTNQTIDVPNRRMTVLVDVSCDTSNPNNPLPVYSRGTTLMHPVDRLRTSPPVDVIAIDHLPTLLPRESSTAFAKDLLPHIKALRERTPVWTRAEDLFQSKVSLIHKKDD
jgi:saccharopine dehydrogenase (NAD+, L-lysine-forming)